MKTITYCEEPMPKDPDAHDDSAATSAAAKHDVPDELLAKLGIDRAKYEEMLEKQTALGFTPFTREQALEYETKAISTLQDAVDVIASVADSISIHQLPRALEQMDAARLGIEMAKSHILRVMHESLGMAMAKAIAATGSGQVQVLDLDAMTGKGTAPPEDVVPRSKEGDGYL